MIRIVIAEDEAVLRQSLTMLLELQEGVEVVAAVPNGEMALKFVLENRVDVLLTDIEMPRLDGIALIAQVKERKPEIRAVVLSKFGDDDRLFAAIKAGAVGYLLKDSSIEEIRSSILEAAEGFGHLSPALVLKTLKEFSRLSEQHHKNRELFSELTRREVEILECIGAGMRNKAIADKFSLSEKTVKSHVTAILRKLELNDRTEAALLASKHGLVEPK